jgi:hypothetical protein
MTTPVPVIFIHGPWTHATANELRGPLSTLEQYRQSS